LPRRRPLAASEDYGSSNPIGTSRVGTSREFGFGGAGRGGAGSWEATRGGAASQALQISVNMDRSVWNAEALNRAIRRPAGQDFSVSLSAGLPYMAFEVLKPLSAHRRFSPHRRGNNPASGEGNKTSVRLQACMPYYPEVRRRSPGRTGRRLSLEWLCPSRSAPCARGAVKVVFSCTEFFHSTPEVSEWRCHRHEYRTDL